MNKDNLRKLIVINGESGKLIAIDQDVKGNGKWRDNLITKRAVVNRNVCKKWGYD
ncbi:MAG: hypothetical protein Ta2E_09930 [Mycoplasmoidaceae bacterium]|nr:MAG: hypothetical protein Ta2E_09930 [Mycoplasmoidaceae bacterium]